MKCVALDIPQTHSTSGVENKDGVGELTPGDMDCGPSPSPCFILLITPRSGSFSPHFTKEQNDSQASLRLAGAAPRILIKHFWP